MRKFFTTGQVARICKIAPKTVINYCEGGIIQSRQSGFGGHRRISREALISFMKTHGLTTDHIDDAVKRRILVVEDNPKTREMLKEMSKTAIEGRVVVDTAEDGCQAILDIAADPPDLLILDLDLPKVNGFEICRHLKQNKKTWEIKILAVTGLPDEDVEQRAIKAGANLCIRKPVTLESLRVALATLLRMRGALLYRYRPVTALAGMEA